MAELHLVGCDLLFFSKASAMAEAAGGHAVNCPIGGPFTPAAGCSVFVSLSKPGPGVLQAITGLKSAGAGPVIAFGSHMDAERLLAARAAGADESIANSQFEARVRQALGA